MFISKTAIRRTFSVKKKDCRTEKMEYQIQRKIVDTCFIGALRVKIGLFTSLNNNGVLPLTYCFNGSLFITFSMVCRNLCERLYSKIIFGRKYCRRCEIYLFHHSKFCPYYGMSQRVSPIARKDKEK